MILYSKPPAGFKPAAKVTGVGTHSPTLWIRRADGRWFADMSIDSGAERLLREYEQLAAWARSSRAKA